jgi:hypothetical protein
MVDHAQGWQAATLDLAHGDGWGVASRLLGCCWQLREGRVGEARRVETERASVVRRKALK